jgi:hypothetical protein
MRGWDWTFNSIQPCRLRENHKAEGNGTTAEWDRLTKRTVLQTGGNSERATDSERMFDGGDAEDKQLHQTL